MISSIVFAIFCTLSVLLVALECWKEYLNRTKLKGFQFSRGLPVLGNLINHLKCDKFKSYKYFNALTERFNGKLGYTWLGPELLFLTEDPRTFETILTSENFLAKPYLFEFFRNQTGLITAATVEIWRPYRRALSPTLGLKKVNSFNSVFNEKAQRMVDAMERDIGKCVDMHRIIFRYATDVAFKTTCDVESPVQNAREDFIMDTISDIFKSVELRIDSTLRKFDFIYKLTRRWDHENLIFSQFRRITDHAIELKKKHLADQLANGTDELALAKKNGTMNLIQKCLQLEQDGQIDRVSVREQVETVLVAGTESNSKYFRLCTCA